MFLKCYCHTTAVGLGNFPVHLGTLTAKSFLKEGHLQFWFLKSHSELLLPFTVNLCHFVWLCTFDFAFTECNLSWYLTTLHSTVKKYTSLFTTNKGHKLVFLAAGKITNNRSSASERVTETNVFQKP